MYVRDGSYYAGGDGASASEMWEYADGYDDGHGAGHEYPYIRHVSVDVESDGGFGYGCCHGGADAYALCASDYGTLDAGEHDGEGDEHAGADGQ